VCRPHCSSLLEDTSSHFFILSSLGDMEIRDLWWMQAVKFSYELGTKTLPLDVIVALLAVSVIIIFCSNNVES
jgi:hypothetical protein